MDLKNAARIGVLGLAGIVGMAGVNCNMPYQNYSYQTKISDPEKETALMLLSRDSGRAVNPEEVRMERRSIIEKGKRVDMRVYTTKMNQEQKEWHEEFFYDDYKTVIGVEWKNGERQKLVVHK